MWVTAALPPSTRIAFTRVDMLSILVRRHVIELLSLSTAFGPAVGSAVHLLYFEVTYQCRQHAHTRFCSYAGAWDMFHYYKDLEGT